VGANPRIAAGSTVVAYWLRLFQYVKRQRYYEDLKKLLPTLDIGSHSNAGYQARLEAGAQRTLEAVACMPWFGLVAALCSRWPLGTARARGYVHCARVASSSVEVVGSRPVFGVRLLTDGFLGPANLLSEQNPP
jgi:hypothetical protein